RQGDKLQRRGRRSKRDRVTAYLEVEVMTLLSRRAVDGAADRVRKERQRPGDRQLVQEYRRMRAAGLPDLLRRVQTTVADMPAVVGCRIKRLDTIVRKLIRRPAMDVTRMQDVLGIRIVCASSNIQARIVDALHARTGAKVLDDYRAAATPL